MRKGLFLFVFSIGFAGLTSCEKPNIEEPEPEVFVAPAPVMVDGHEAIDLGLPSGTLWATCNVGAERPEEYGDYFAWGETETKSYYWWSTYKWCTYDSVANEAHITKYYVEFEHPYHWASGDVDAKTCLDKEDDAAYVQWGKKWRMPTSEELEELLTYSVVVDAIVQDKNGLDVRGLNVTGPSGKSIFLPAAGYKHGDYSDTHAGEEGAYWTSTLDEAATLGQQLWYWWNHKDTRILGESYRWGGYSIRPVTDSKE